MKLVSSAMLAAVACVAAMADASPLPVVSVQTTTPTVSIGNAVVIEVAITGASDLYGFQLDLQFDPSLLAFTGGASTEGAFLPSGGTTIFIPGTDNGSGAVTNTADSLIGAIPGVSGNGILASFDFTAIGAGLSALTLANVLLVDSVGDLIAFNTSGSSVTIESAGSLPEPGTLLLLALGLATLGLARRRAAASAMRRDSK